MMATDAYIKVKKGKGTNYVFSFRKEDVYTSKLKPLYTVSLQSIKLSGYKMRTNFSEDPLALEQNNYETKIVNAYILYGLKNRPNNPLRYITFKSFLFAATNLVKIAITKSGCIAFDGKGQLRFGNGYARNVVIFGVDNSSSSHANNCKNNFLILRKGDTFGINVGFAATEKKVQYYFQ